MVGIDSKRLAAAGCLSLDCSGGTAERQTFFTEQAMARIPADDAAWIRGLAMVPRLCAHCGCVYTRSPAAILGWFENGATGKLWERAS